MKLRFVAIALALSLSSPAWSKNFAFPEENPAATISIPNKWKTNDVEYGFEARSAGNDIYLSVESAPAKSMTKMIDSSMEWMKRSGISVTGKPQEAPINFGTLVGKLQIFPAKDESGDTQIALILAESKNRIIMITIWESEEEDKAHKREIDDILKSIKPIQ